MDPVVAFFVLPGNAYAFVYVDDAISGYRAEVSMRNGKFLVKCFGDQVKAITWARTTAGRRNGEAHP